VPPARADPAAAHCTTGEREEGISE
jgi:hypothetical protein